MFATRAVAGKQVIIVLQRKREAYLGCLRGTVRPSAVCIRMVRVATAVLCMSAAYACTQAPAPAARVARVARAEVGRKPEPLEPAPNRTGPDGWTPLQRAAQAGDIALLERLVAAGGDVNTQTAAAYHGAAPIELALEYAHSDAALWLLQRQARVDGAVGTRAFALAARGGFVDVLSALQARGVSAQTASALHAACRGNHTAAIAWLLAHGADVNAPQPDDHAFTPLMVAAMENHVAAAALLIAAKANVEAVDTEGRTALHWAVFGARPAEVHEYRELGAPHDTHWQSQIAAPLVALLLQYGANVDAQDREGATATHDAIAFGALAALDELLCARPNLQRVNRAGLTALAYARARQANEAITALRLARQQKLRCPPPSRPRALVFEKHR